MRINNLISPMGIILILIFSFAVVSTPHELSFIGFAWAHLNEKYIENATINKAFIDKTVTSHYIIITDKGAYEIGKPLLDIFNNSRNANVNWAKIKEGRTYNLHSYGYRIDFLYVYPIVVDVQEI
jgi:hypothetical protein